MGIIIYFALPVEPAIKFPIIISILCAANFFVLRKDKFLLVRIAMAFSFGFFYSAAYTRLLDTKIINRPLREIEISGRVANIDYAPDKTRLFITTDSLKATNFEKTTIRATISDDASAPSIGAKITATATLYPPGGPDAPGGYDFAEWSYFNGLAATGFITKFTADNEQAAGIAVLRDRLHKKLNSKLSDALVLGYNHALTDDENNAWKAAGVSHVFSISGFHISLVAGWLFAFFYFLFRGVAPLSRRIPARYPATIFAGFGILFYLLLSGSGVATQRAFLMTSLVFMAFIFGRNVFSMRNAAIVFAALLFCNPHYLFDAGFQLSFAAIFGMIWLFGDMKHKKRTFIQKAWNALKIMIATTIVCSVFTAPFIAYNFQTAQIYSLLGNLLCLPIFSLLIMPLVMLGIVFPIFSVWATDVYNLTLKVAEWIAGLPFAALQLPTVSGPALLLFVASLLCVMLIENKKLKVLFTGIFAILAVVWITLAPRPILYAASDHQLVGYVRDGKLEFNHGKSSAHYFTFDTWKKMNFEKAGSENQRIKCEKGVCKFETKNWSLTYIQNFTPLLRNIDEICNTDSLTKPNYFVAYFDVSAPNCKAKILRGGFVIYESGRIEYVSTRWMNR